MKPKSYNHTTEEEKNKMAAMRVTLCNHTTGELNELHGVRRITREELHGTRFIGCEYNDELRLFPADQWEVYTVKVEQ